MTEALQTLIDAASLGSLFALCALGVGLLFGILRLVNFAQGDFITIGAYALIVPSSQELAQMAIGEWAWYLVIPAVCLVVMIVALVSDLLIFRSMRKAPAPTLMVASFALSYTIQNIILVIYGGRPKAVNLWSGLNGQLLIGSLRVPILQIVTISVTLSLLAILSSFLRRNRYGIMMRAAAEDFEMARHLGVRGNVVIGIAFAICGVLAGIVALLLLCQTGSLNPTMGVPLVLFAFVAVVVGGMGSLTGAVLGGFVVGLVLTLLQAYLPPDLRAFREAFAFAFVILVLVLKPSGLVKTKSLIERV
jgi:branched-chain amino acid transport system permease protein